MPGISMRVAWVYVVGALRRQSWLLAIYLGEGRSERTCDPMSYGGPAMRARGPRQLNRGRLIITPSYHKLVDVVLCILHEAERLGVVPTQYDIVKSTFLADRRVLNRFGVPITFDAYYAMEHGPVPMTLFNLLKGDPDVVAKTGEPQWSVRRRAGSDKVLEFHSPRRPVDEDVLDGVEEAELREALSLVVRLGVSGVRARTHQDRAYRAAWREDDDRTAFAMSYRDMLDVPDDDILQNLAHASGLTA